jgi:hypothetical protein
MYKRVSAVLLVVAFTFSNSIAQDTTRKSNSGDTGNGDLFKMLDEENKQEDKKRTDYTSATFKTTRLINGHSIETVGKRVLDVKISHRFNQLSDGLYNLFGLDNATMRMGVDYGLTQRLMIGVGRSTFEKQYDGFLKYKLLRQSTGYKTMPVTVSLVASAMIATDTSALRSRYLSSRPKTPVDSLPTSAKMVYSYQLIIGRKFSESTSLQIMPSVVHYNMVEKANQPNDLFALGIGGRQKLSKRISFNAEYYYVFPDYKLPGTHNSLAIGFDIETGGHVFQLHFTNSRGMTEKTFIAETQGSWGNGDVGFGFNIARVFTIGGRKKKSE